MKTAKEVLTELWPYHEMLSRETALQAMQAYADQSIDYFVDELFSALKRHGIDTSNWDGDEGVIETLATCIAEDRQEYADQFRPKWISVEEKEATEEEAKEWFARIYMGNTWRDITYQDMVGFANYHIKSHMPNGCAPAPPETDKP